MPVFSGSSLALPARTLHSTKVDFDLRGNFLL